MMMMMMMMIVSLLVINVKYLFILGAKVVGRPRGCAPCSQEHTNKTRVKPDIPTKSYTCMSTSRLLGNVYTAKSCKGKKRVPDALKSGLVS